MGDLPSVGLSASLRSSGFKLGRLQTGTPARLYKRSIDFNQLAVQRGDESPIPFSYLNTNVDNAVRHATQATLPHTHRAFLSPQNNQVQCYQTFTSPKTHQIIKDNLHRSIHIQETRKGS